MHCQRVHAKFANAADGYYPQFAIQGRSLPLFKLLRLRQAISFNQKMAERAEA
jgi:hypothetical protein